MFSSTARTRSVEGTAESSGVVGADGGERVLQDLGGIDIIHLAVGEIASSLPEPMSFAISPRAKLNPFQRCPAWAKSAFVDLQRQLRLKVRESKTEGMLARS